MAFSPSVGDINANASQNNLSAVVLGDVSDVTSARTNYTINASQFSIIWTHRRLATGASSYCLTTDGNRMLIGYGGSDEMRCQVDQTGGTPSVDQITTDTYTDTASWHTALWHFDEANATAGDRCKTFRDGVEITNFTTDVSTGGTFATDFTNFTINPTKDVLTYQVAIVSGVLVPASDTYDTVSGKPKDLRGISGLAMLGMMQKDGTFRDLAANVDWTQTGEVIRSTEVPDLA